MARNLIAIYVWLVDAIENHGRLTLSEINRLWVASPMSDGKPFKQRTFFNMRNSIESMFGINIVCDRSTYEYYIESPNNENASRMHHWLLDSFSMSGMLANSSDLSSRILLEDVPSARENLPLVITAMREGKRIRFSYTTYKRSKPTEGVVIAPYFVKIFKQLWYVIGYNVAEAKIKTYALDRMSGLVIAEDTFEMPPNFEPANFFKYSFGIMQSQSEPKEVVLRVSAEQAKYLRALPLHHTQKEVVHDTFSLFTYKMLITYDLCEHILSFGGHVTVIQPLELRAEILSRLRAALENY